MAAITVSQTISDRFEKDPASPNRTSTTSDNHNALQERLTNPPLEDSQSLQAESRLALTVVMLQPCLVSFFSCFPNGVITVGLQTIVAAISLERALYTWPSSVFGLTSRSILLVAGAVSDLLGARYVEFFGILQLGVATIACGLSNTGVQVIIFRHAAHLPASVSLVSAALPSGKVRNIGFACLGLSQPLGFAAGLVLGGILIQRMGWAIGFYLAGGPILGIALAGYRTLPKPPNDQTRGVGARIVLRKLYTDIDWLGAGLASLGLALLSYVLA
ncbi:major facilitator superfamily domain-containing protein [Xylariaceae sp. FL1019]|nr:major facilitator superfamily domain-containing protein [Xylariaceae sp. FL1019]